MNLFDIIISQINCFPYDVQNIKIYIILDICNQSALGG